MIFTLPDLPYARDALAPYMSAETLELHHGKHLRGSTAMTRKANRTVSWKRLTTQRKVAVVGESS